MLGGKSWEPKLPLADNIIDPLTHINAQQGPINAQLTHTGESMNAQLTHTGERLTYINAHRVAIHAH